MVEGNNFIHLDFDKSVKLLKAHFQISVADDESVSDVFQRFILHIHNKASYLAVRPMDSIIVFEDDLQWKNDRTAAGSIGVNVDRLFPSEFVGHRYFYISYLDIQSEVLSYFHS